MRVETALISTPFSINEVAKVRRVNGDSKLIQISFAKRFKTDTPQIPSFRCNCCLQDGPKAQLEGGNYHAALNR